MMGLEATRSIFNMKLMLGFLLLSISITLSTLYSTLVASSFAEYIQCLCLISALLSMAGCIVAVVLKKVELFDYIEKMEKFINASE